MKKLNETQIALLLHFGGVDSSYDRNLYFYHRDFNDFVTTIMLFNEEDIFFVKRLDKGIILIHQYDEETYDIYFFGFIEKETEELRNSMLKIKDNIEDILYE